MSGTPNKRSHEEGGAGQSSASRYSRDDSSTYSNITPKLPPSASNDYHDMASDAPRLHKIPRTESRDVDQKLYSPHRVLQTILYDSHSDHPIPSEDRIEHRDVKNSNRDPKVDIRDTKTDSRELYQGSKVGKDVRFSSRGEDGKETKSGWNTFPDYRSEMKPDKDGGYSTVNNHLNWNESADHHHRAKKYTDNSGGVVDTWQRSRSAMHRPADTEIEGSTREEKDYTEVSEAVGENKVDMKGEDKLKDKDRKRKDVKPRDWGERDKEINESRNNLILGNSSNEFNEPSMEERKAENREKERKDFSHDKDKPRDMEKDHVRIDARSGTEKEGLKIEKEIIDVSVRAPGQENLSLDRKKVKDSDRYKEYNDRKKERNTDFEGEKSEKHPICFDKEPDHGGADAEGGAEREREGLNYGIQQRKRMLRPRGSPQVGVREPCFRSQDQDNEGPKGKPDMSIVVYRVGECMQELIKLWKEYESSQPDKMSESSQNGPTLEIRIPAETVTATNRQVRGGQLWGTDIYTIDSDLVAVLMHTGYCRPTASPPPPVTQELRATIRVLPPQDCYISTLRNNVRSRAWGAAIGCSYRVERCCIVKKGGGMIDLEPCLTHTSTVEPTLAPVVVERTMTTRAAASNALRQQRFVREVTIQYNLCNEPWIKYSISAVADKGLKKPLFTSARLKKGEVLYMESHSCRYELCFNGEKMVKAIPSSHENEKESEKHQAQGVHPTNGERSTTDSDTVVMDVFRWSCCKNPLPQKVMCTIGIPLPLENLEVIEENLDWEDIKWSQTGVWISGKEYPLARVHFMSPN